jgi:O-methyltransferase/methyltransferase family protein
MAEPGALLALVNGYQASQALHVAVRLGVPDRLADGPRAVEELAVDADPDALRRLLRALAALGVLREDDGRYALTDLGEGLRSDVPGSLAGWAAFVGRPYHWSAWASLEHSVRTGENAFRAVHGTDVWAYRRAHPEEAEIFDRAMTSLTAQVDAAVAAAHDFGRYGTVVDVGGGHGGLLAALLARHPGVRGVVFDQPEVVAGLEPPAGCTVVGGSFFEAVPPGGDAYVLKSVLHDWEDADAVRILRACHAAGAPVVLVVERDLAANPRAALSDLNMLVSPGGRERTLAEYAALLEAGGFRLVGSAVTAPGFAVIEAARAPEL